MAMGLEKIVGSVKKAIATGLAGSMLLTAVPVKALGEWEEVNRFTTKQEVGQVSKVNLEYKIDIDNAKISDNRENILIPLEKSKSKDIYQQYNEILNGNFKEYCTSTKNIIKYPGLNVLAYLLAAGAYSQFSDNKNGSEGAGWACTLLACLAYGGARKKENIKEYTGKTKKEIISTTPKEKSVKRGEIIYKNKPANSVNFEIITEKYMGPYGVSNYLDIPTTGKTDSNGNIKIKIKKRPTSLKFLPTFRGTVRSPSDIEGLEIYDSPSFNQNNLVRMIKPSFRDSIIKQIEKSDSTYTEKITIKTKENSLDSIKITNGYRRFDARIIRKEMTDDHIYRALENFINFKINSKIKRVTLQARDINTDFGISSPVFIIQKAPNPKDLLSPYFEGELLDWACPKIYLSEFNGGCGNKYGEMQFYVYTPFKYIIKTKHPNYRFEEKTIDFAGLEENGTKIIYLNDLGSKVRVRSVTE